MADPLGYWLLTLSCIFLGPLFLWGGFLRHRGVIADAAPEPPPPRPAWARGLAWIGVAAGVALLAAAVAAHLTMDPIISLWFVAVLGGGGLVITLASVGYLVTGRL